MEATVCRMESTTADAARSPSQLGCHRQAGSPVAEAQSKPHWAGGLDELALMAVTDEVLEGLRRSSEGQPEQDEMLFVLTGMRGELSGD
jgi:hypothetical protein